MLKPIIQWAGGKTRLLNEINTNLPNKNILDSIETYVEPFLGGGSTLLDIVPKLPNVKKVYVNDINERLINLYKNIKYNVNELVYILDKIYNEFGNLKDEKLKEEYYYKIRKEFNDITKYNSIKNAAQFIFINKYCFNAVYRENSKGEFNVSFNKKYQYKFYNKEDIYDLHDFLIKYDVVFYSKPYNEFLANIFNILYREKDNDSDAKNRIKTFERTFMYLDPPYRPLDKKQSVKYSGIVNIYSDYFQIEIEKYYSLFSDYGTYCMLSNSDPHNVDSTDDFFDNLYKCSNIKRVNIKRLIGCKSSSRNTITELLITNY